MATKISGPGRAGSVKKLKESLKSKGNPNVRNIPSENSLTGRFLDEPEDFYGYYEHWIDKVPHPCTEDDCEGCSSDNPDERQRNFRYLANFYSVDDSKVVAVKLPKSLVEQLTNYYGKFGGTLLDRDYDLSKSGSGMNGTKYLAAPDVPSKMKLDRFKKLDLEAILQSLVDGEDTTDEDEEKPKSKKKKSKEESPWEAEKPKKKKGKPEVKSSKPVVKSKKKSTPTRTIIRKK